MKKIIISWILLLAMVVSALPIYAIDFEAGNLPEQISDSDEMHTVSFRTNSGSLIADALVADGDCVYAPIASPTKDGYLFAGWYTEDGKYYDFYEPVTESFTLTAGWVADTVPAATVDASQIYFDLDYLEIWHGMDLQIHAIAKYTKSGEAKEGIFNVPLTFHSLNSFVASVDTSGNIHANDYGTTYVWAVAAENYSQTFEGADSAVTVSAGDVLGKIEVNVCYPPSYYKLYQSDTENQQVSLPNTSTDRINVNDFVSWPSGAYGSANIALWKDNAKGVVTVTVDDSIVSNFDEWTVYHNEYGVNVTFYVPTGGGKGNQSTWEEMIEKGHSVQSHTLSHPSTGNYEIMSEAAEWMDFYVSAKQINQMLQIPSLTVAYSWGYNNEELSNKLFIGGRGVYGVSNGVKRTNYNSASSYSGFSSKSIANIAATHTEGGSNFGGWVSTHYHQIGETTILESTLAHISAAQEAGELWSAFFSDASQYGQERDTATLSVTSATANQVKFNLTDKMNDELFTLPLTVKIKVDGTWQYAAATQNGVKRDVKIVTNSEGTFLMVDAVPDAGEVTVTRLASEPEAPALDINYDTKGQADYTMSQLYYGLCTPATGEKVAVTSEAEWDMFAAYVNAGNDCAGMELVLTADLNLTKLDHFNPVGRETSVGPRMRYNFSGTFDGQNHTVTYVAMRDGSYAGLFGCLSGASILNLHVNTTLTGSCYVGGIAGLASGSLIKGCTVSGSVLGKSENISQSDYGSVGGIAGSLGGSSTVDSCVNYATVISVSDHVGGITGAFSKATITNSASFGTIEGRTSVGAIAGSIRSGSSGTTTQALNCLAAGTVRGQDYVGGACGRMGSMPFARALNIVSVAKVVVLNEDFENYGAVVGMMDRNAIYNQPQTAFYYVESVNEGMQTCHLVHYQSGDKYAETKITAHAVTMADLASDAQIAALNTEAAKITYASCGEWQTVTYGGLTLPSPVSLTVEEPAPAPVTYTVTFLGKDGQVLKVQTVSEGNDASAPIAPTLVGYDFVGWSLEFTAVSENLVVEAIYERNETPLPVFYTVTFLDKDGSVLSTQSILEGSSATAPAAPTVEEYTFVGWSADFSAVTGNMTVSAQYKLSYVLEEDAAYIEFKSIVAAFADAESASLAEKYQALYEAALAFADIKDKEAAASTEAYTDYVALAASYNAEASIVAKDIVTHKK